MKQKINTLLASLALLLCSITMSAQTFEVDGIRYTVYNENEVYVSSGSQYEGDLIIPESVAYSGNDHKVTSIGDRDFYFSNLFLKKTGFSPLQYLNMLRIRKACQYLDNTNMKINQIAPLVGIDDNFYFSRLFTKVMGITPSQYRSDKKG